LVAAALALAAPVLPAFAEPPTPGSTHTFRDPIFQGTVFCDTLDQVRDIAVADEPNSIYAMYRITPNQRNEPICMAIIPTGLVVSVTRIGTMVREGDRYTAWAVETVVAGFTAYALYLERVTYVSI
jgi:hypothetical protein